MGHLAGADNMVLFLRIVYSCLKLGRAAPFLETIVGNTLVFNLRRVSLLCGKVPALD